ncbi:MAG: PAS domain S-box protein [Chloroflexi bacterium]|nr:PAS domain S-box protein [Chloroflexota bacterium]
MTPKKNTPKQPAGKGGKPRPTPAPRAKKTRAPAAQALHPEASNILERVSDSFVALDAEWRYTYVNEKAAATFGRTPDQMIGKHIWTEFPEGIGQPFYHAYHKAMETQQPIAIEEYYSPYDRWFENRIYPSPDGLTIFFHDITEIKQTELALQAAQGDLLRILRAANVGLWDWDLRANTVYFSPEWKAQIGYAEHEISNDFSEWETRVHPDDLERALAGVNAFIKDPRPDFANEFRFRHRNGTYRHILAQAALEFDETGKPIRMLGSHIDITERKRVEEQLQRNEQLLRLFVEYSPAAIAMFNRDMEYIAASRRYLIDYGLGEQDVRGRSHYEVFPEIPDRWKQIHRRCLAGAVERAEEDPFPRLSGKLDWIRWEIHPWYEAGGEIGGIILFSEVITESIEARHTLREMVELLDEAQTIAKVGSVTFDVATQERWWSRQAFELFGLEPHPEGRAPEIEEFLKRILPEDHDRMREEFRLMAAGQDPPPWEFRAYSANNAICVFSRIMRVRRADGGRALQFHGIMQDITERKRVEDALQEHNQRFEDAEALALVGSWEVVVATSERRWSKQLYRMLGLQPDPQGNPPDFDEFAHHFHPDDRDYIRQSQAEILAGREPLPHLLRSDPARGPMRYYFPMWRIVRGADGKPQRFQGTIQDITNLRQAEDARAEAEDKYRQIFENAQEAIHRTTPEGRYLAANPAAARMLGYASPEELIAAVSDLDRQFYVQPGRREEFKRRMEEHGEVTGFESEAYRKDGSTFWVSENDRAVRDQHGHLLYYEGTSVDITERKRAEEALRESEARYRQLMEVSPIGVAVHSEGRLVFVNPAGARILGAASPEELTGKSIIEIIHPGNLAAARERIQRLLAGEQGLYPVEDLYLRLDGTPVPVEVMAVPLTYGGKPAVQVMVQDITRRKQAEAERDRLWNYSLDMLCIAGFDGYFKQLNPAWEVTLGWSEEELFAQPYLNLVHPDDREATANTASRLIGGRPALSFENRYLCKDGTYKWLAWSSYPLKEEELVFAVARDITERKRAEARIQEQLARLTALREIDDAIRSSTDMRLVLSVLARLSAAALGADAIAVLLLDPALQTLRYAAGFGFHTPAVENTNLLLGESYAGLAARDRRLVEIRSFDEDPEGMLTGLLKDEGFANYHGIPLMVKGQVIGVLEAFHRSRAERSDEWHHFFATLAGQAAIAIDSARLFEDLRRSHTDLTRAYDATIEGWSYALDLRDKETEGHTRRVTEMAVDLARRMSLGEAELVQVRRGALLHDIGKLGVPDAILHKPGALTDEEWEAMRRHPGFAYQMLQPIAYLRPALDIPYSHHEKWDGTGYPRGLKGEDIPLMARIFAVVDVWDALTSDRPYRPAWTKKQTRKHIREQSGRHFDPKVVQAFLALVGE